MMAKLCKLNVIQGDNISLDEEQRTLQTKAKFNHKHRCASELNISI